MSCQATICVFTLSSRPSNSPSTSSLSWYESRPFGFRRALSGYDPPRGAAGYVLGTAYPGETALFRATKTVGNPVAYSSATDCPANYRSDLRHAETRQMKFARSRAQQVVPRRTGQSIDLHCKSDQYGKTDQENPTDDEDAILSQPVSGFSLLRWCCGPNDEQTSGAGRIVANLTLCITVVSAFFVFGGYNTPL